MKAKLLLLSGFVAAGLFGCMESDNYIIFTDYVTMEAGLLPDTMVLDSTYNIPFRASAPNGCWSDLRVYMNIQDDSLYFFSAEGTFENHGEACTQQVVTHDTIIAITPKVNKTHIMSFLNPTGNPQVRVDTVYIKPE